MAKITDVTYRVSVVVEEVSNMGEFADGHQMIRKHKVASRTVFQTDDEDLSGTVMRLVENMANEFIVTDFVHTDKASKNDITLDEGINVLKDAGMMVLTADTPEDIDKWPHPDTLFGTPDSRAEAQRMSQEMDIVD